jgi:hypothetical protein
MCALPKQLAAALCSALTSAGLWLAWPLVLVPKDGPSRVHGGTVAAVVVQRVEVERAMV